MCRLYGVTRAGYYAWRKRPVAERKQVDQKLLQRIREIHQASRGIYGSPRVHMKMKKAGEHIGRKRVERLMRENGIRARASRIYRSKPYQHEFLANIRNETLEKDLDGADQIWVGDITYLKVAGEWRYLATVMDRYSRRLLGWSLGKNRKTELTIRALNHAVRNRGKSHGIVFHSDRGTEYASEAYRQHLVKLGMIQSMNRPGKMTDNIFMESFYHSMKSDVIHGVEFRTDEELRAVIRGYMQFYNQSRIHTSLEGYSPVQYELQCSKMGVN